MWMIKFLAYNNSVVKLHKRTSVAHKPPFYMAAEPGPLLYEVSSLEGTAGDLQRTQSGQLLAD